MRSRLKVTAIITETAHVVTATGREGETLRQLVLRGPRGLSPLDAHRAGPAFRLAAYVQDLRKMGVPIRTDREAHDGGSHARYRLEGEVRVLSIAGEGAMEAARQGVLAND